MYFIFKIGYYKNIVNNDLEKRYEQRKSDFEHQHDHSCDCGHDHDEDLEIITLTLDDGTEVECGIIGTYEVEDKSYMALLAIEDEEILLFNYEEDEEGFEITPIEDDEEFDLAAEAYYELFADEFDDLEDTE